MRLTRSKSDKMMAGVCGGVASYLNIDPFWVRLAFVLLVFTSGIGILLYLILWFIMPWEGKTSHFTNESFSENVASEMKNLKEQNGAPSLLGWVLIAVGTYFLLSNLGWLIGVAGSWFWVLVVLGIVVWFVRRK